jgi:hypothetical protein
MKICTKCGEEKPVAEFNYQRTKYNPNRRHARCSKCTSAAQQDYLRATGVIPRPPSQCFHFTTPVYFIQAQESLRIKIGLATDPVVRLYTLKLGSPEELILLGTVVGGGRTLERSLHKRFRASRLHGEWFTATPELMSWIRDNAQMAEVAL